MNKEKPLGLYLFKKQSKEHLVLKEMLQFVKTVSPASTLSFSYVEANDSLHPHLSLWENLQLVMAGVSSWKELCQELIPEQQAMLNLLKEPTKKVKDAEKWEKFIVSFFKAILGPARNVLIDMNEEIISPFLIQGLKNIVLSCMETKTIYLASSNMSIWLDCAHSVVNKIEYKFEIETLVPERKIS
jgi:ABC-type branched-subunit amino acid transport system ATPase component